MNNLPHAFALARAQRQQQMAPPRPPLVSKFNRLLELARAERQLRNLEKEEAALKTLDYGMALRRRDLERRIAFFGSLA